MKKFGIYLVAFVSICAMVCVIHASARGDESDVIVEMQINNPIMVVNGTAMEIDEGRGTAPVISNGRTLVPIRSIIEAFCGAVEWRDETDSVYLMLEGENIVLTINSCVAYVNGVEYTMDVAPVIISERTMLPIRFIAESFNLGVAWNDATDTVTVIRNYFDDEEYQRLMKDLPVYSGSPYTVINDNRPYFEEYEIIDASFEYYSRLDDAGRCDVCMASVASDIMPTEERGSISSVTPTGWINASYDIVDGGYLYNRCHLIGFQLTGENANERNLITGTRYLNIDGMLPFENMIDDYIDDTGNRVMYRVTPVFTDENSVADGVLMEAYSVEDSGSGISFCVYCYNVQPGVMIDYATGKSGIGGVADVCGTDAEVDAADRQVYRTPNGTKYHYSAQCGGKNSYLVTTQEALKDGLDACLKCAS